MQKLRDKLISHSLVVNENRRKLGYLATISPSPVDLIINISLDICDSIGQSKDPIIFYDLGSGDGRWIELFKFMCQFRGINCFGIGIELDSDRIATTMQNIKANTLLNSHALEQFKSSISKSDSCCTCEFIQSNFMDLNYSSANVVITYLSREGNETLHEKLSKDCSPTTIVIAVGFKMPASTSWQLQNIYISESTGLKAYKYMI